jgi:hypothetical protein
MHNGLYDKLSSKCKSTIKSKSPQNSINIISNMKLPGKSNSMGKDNALKIYNLYSDHSIEYNSSKYKNNINSYKDSVQSNKNIANKYCKD